MGTSDFAVPTLEALIKREKVIGVVTQPDRPRGRGRRVSFSPVKEMALRYGLPLFQPEKISSPRVVRQMRDWDPDLIVVTAFGQIIPSQILGIPSWGCVNLHASLLPRYRGAAPVEWALIKGERISGVTAILMEEGVDSGPIIAQKKTEVLPQDTGGTLGERLSWLAVEVLDEVLRMIERGRLISRPQEEREVTYAPPLSPEDALIHWENPAVEVHNLVRALNPRLGAYTTLDLGRGGKKRLKIWKTEIYEEEERGKKDGKVKGRPGEIMRILKKEGIVVHCGEGSLLLKEVQLEGKKRMSALEFLRGYPLKPGSFLGQVRYVF